MTTIWASVPEPTNAFGESNLVNGLRVGLGLLVVTAGISCVQEPSKIVDPGVKADSQSLATLSEDIGVAKIIGLREGNFHRVDIFENVQNAGARLIQTESQRISSVANTDREIEVELVTDKAGVDGDVSKPIRRVFNFTIDKADMASLSFGLLALKELSLWTSSQDQPSSSKSPEYYNYYRREATVNLPLLSRERIRCESSCPKLSSIETGVDIVSWTTATEFQKTTLSYVVARELPVYFITSGDGSGAGVFPSQLMSFCIKSSVFDEGSKTRIPILQCRQVSDYLTPQESP